MFVGVAHAQQVDDAVKTVSQTAIKWWDHPLVWMETGVLLLTLLVLPGYAAWRSRTESSAPLKGLNLPEGSVRAMLALLIVGSFANVLLFGASVLGNGFEQVGTAFGTLAGAVTGFYFAGRKTN